MMLLFDFDRTLYSIDDLKDHVIKGLLRRTYDQREFFDSIQDFVYPDVVPFFEKYADKYDCKLLTYGEEDIQETKVKHSGIEHYFSEVFYIDGGSKGPFIKECATSTDSDVLFIDDTRKHLFELQEECPEVRGIRMRRVGAKGASIPEETFEEIHDLLGLEKLLE